MDTLIDVGGVDFTKYALSAIQYVQWLKIGRLATSLNIVFSSPEPKAQGELIVYRSSHRLSVCVSVCGHFQTRISQQPVGQS